MAGIDGGAKLKKASDREVSFTYDHFLLRILMLFAVLNLMLFLLLIRMPPPRALSALSAGGCCAGGERSRRAALGYLGRGEAQEGDAEGGGGRLLPLFPLLVVPVVLELRSVVLLALVVVVVVVLLLLLLLLLTLVLLLLLTLVLLLLLLTLVPRPLQKPKGSDNAVVGVLAAALIARRAGMKQKDKGDDSDDSDSDSDSNDDW